jgi:hypothetical protein
VASHHTIDRPTKELEEVEGHITTIITDASERLVHLFSSLILIREHETLHMILIIPESFALTIPKPRMERKAQAGDRIRPLSPLQLLAGILIGIENLTH